MVALCVHSNAAWPDVGPTVAATVINRDLWHYEKKEGEKGWGLSLDVRMAFESRRRSC